MLRACMVSILLMISPSAPPLSMIMASARGHCQSGSDDGQTIIAEDTTNHSKPIRFSSVSVSRKKSCQALFFLKAIS